MHLLTITHTHNSSTSTNHLYPVPAGGRPHGYISRQRNDQPCWWTFPELSNASRARGFFSKNNIRDGLVGRFPSKQWGYFMASQLNTWNCWSGIYWIISRPMFGWFFLWVWKLWWDDEAGWTRNGGGGAGIQTNGVWSFFRVVNLEENFLINSWEGPPQMLGSWVVPPFSSVSSVANWLRWSRCLHRLFWRSST